MKVSPAELRPILNDVLGPVPYRTTSTASNHIRIQYRAGKKPVLELQTVAELAAEGRLVPEGDWPFGDEPFYVERKLFAKYIGAMKPNKPITLANKDGELIVSQGGLRGRFVNIEGVAGYMTFGKFKGEEVNFHEDDIALLQLCAATASQSDVDPHMHGVFLSGGFAMSTNSEVITRGPISYKGEAVGIPLEIIPLLAQAKKVEFGESGIRLTFPNGIIEQPYSEEVLTNFPVDGIAGYLEMASGYDEQLTAPAPTLNMHLETFTMLTSSATGSVTDPLLEMKTAKARGGKVVLAMKLEPKHGTDFAAKVTPGGKPKPGFEALVRLNSISSAVKRLAALGGDGPISLAANDDSPGIVLKRGDVIVSLARSVAIDDGNDTAVTEEESE